MVNLATLNRLRQNAGFEPLGGSGPTNRNTKTPPTIVEPPKPEVNVRFPKPTNTPQGIISDKPTTIDNGLSNEPIPTYGDVGIFSYNNDQRPSTSVSSTKELQVLFDDGLITPDQFKASRDKLLQGYSGVNPFGFSNFDEQGNVAQVGGTKYDPVTGRPSAVAAANSQQANQQRPGDITPDRVTAGRNVRSLASTPVADRLANAGIDEQMAGLFNILGEGGFQGTGGSSGKLTLTAVTPDLMKKLNEAGYKFEVYNTGDKQANAEGLRNIVFLGVAEEDYDKKGDLYEKITTGGDIQDQLDEFERIFANDAETAYSSGMQKGAYQPGSGVGSEDASKASPYFSGAGAAFSNLPEEAQFLAPFLQQFLQSSQQNLMESGGIAQTLLGKAQDTHAQVSSKLRGMASGYQATAGAMQGFIEKARDQNEQYIAARERAERERLNWTAQRGLRDIAKRKVETHDSMVAQLALGGGFGQDAGLRAIRESDEKYEQAMDDFRSEIGVQRTEMVAKFSGLYLENQNNFINGTLQNMKDLQGKLERLEFQDIENTQLFSQQESSILETAWTNQVNLRTQLSKDTLGVAEKILGFIQDEKATKAEEHSASYKDMIDVFTKTGPGSSVRQMALDRMEAAGWDVSNLDINDNSFASHAELKEQAKMAMYDPYQFTREDDQKIMGMALTTTDSLSAEGEERQLAYIRNLLQKGKRDEAINHLRGIAVKGLNGSIAEKYAQRKTIIEASQPLISELQAIKDTPEGEELFTTLQGIHQEYNKRITKEGGYRLLQKDTEDAAKLRAKHFNWYTKEMQNAKNKLGVDKNPALSRIFAQVENIAGIIINERYGAAVTDGEMARAREYIAMSGNTLGDMITKLKTYATFSQQTNDNLIFTEMPDFASGTLDDSPPMSTPGNFNDDYFKNLDDAGANEIFVPNANGEQQSYNLQTESFDGRRVTLAKPAMDAFQMANNEFRQDHGMDIRIGAIEYASYRNQADTIKYMARKNGVKFDPTNPNKTAAKLRSMGHQVADVGNSLHEQGLALDLYPLPITVANNSLDGTEYIELVKPYLERYGFLQRNHGGNDPGNFEFQMS